MNISNRNRHESLGKIHAREVKDEHELFVVNFFFGSPHYESLMRKGLKDVHPHFAYFDTS